MVHLYPSSAPNIKVGLCWHQEFEVEGPVCYRLGCMLIQGLSMFELECGLK